MDTTRKICCLIKINHNILEIEIVAKRWLIIEYWDLIASFFFILIYNLEHKNST